MEDLTIVIIGPDGQPTGKTRTIKLPDPIPEEDSPNHPINEENDNEEITRQ